MSNSHLDPLFATQFGGAPTFAVRSPGRVNLIGEHVDYNDGLVLPMALSLQTDLLLRERDDDRVILYSTFFGQKREFHASNLQKSGSWIDYAQAVVHVLRAQGHQLRGFEGVLTSDVPLASGLSSSASFEVGVALAFCHTLGLEKSPDEIARLCQKAENEFIGVNCGIMDQMSVAACRENHALLLDCRDHSMRQVPFVLKNHAIVVTDSAAPRELASSAYNERRAQCEAGLAKLQQFLPHARSLRDVLPADFARHEGKLENVVARRVRHVVSEIARTQDAVRALENSDLAGFGARMNESHLSLRDDYEVSSRELEFLTDFARGFEGVLGSRMTGAGFGGCTVTLVQKSRAAALIEAKIAAYKEATGRQARAWICEARDGASASKI